MNKSLRTGTNHKPRNSGISIGGLRSVRLREAVAETTAPQLVRGGAGTDNDEDDTTVAASTQTDPSVPTGTPRGSKQCPTCVGTGADDNGVCPRCEGAGTVGEPLQRAQILTEAKAARQLVSLHPRFAGHPRRLREAAADTSAVYDVEIVSEGLGNQKDKVFYTKQTLKEAAASGVFNGMQAYANHPGKDEEINRPERDVRALVGYYRNFKFRESGSEGKPCVAAELVVNQGDGTKWFVDLLESAIAAKGDGVDLCGISIDAEGLVELGEVDKQYVSLCRQITEASSADIVTRPAAGGNIVRRLRESIQRTRPPVAQGGTMTPEDLKTKLTAAHTRLRESQAKLVKDGASEDEIAEALKGIREGTDQIETLSGVQVELREAETPTVEPTPAAGTGTETETEVKLREAETKLKDETDKRVKLERNMLAAQALQEAEVPKDRAKFLFPQLQQYATAEQMTTHIKGQEEYEEGLLTRLRESAGLPAPRVEGAGALKPVPAFTGATDVDKLASMGIPVLPVPDNTAATA